MQASYKVTLTDYRSALRLHYRQRGRWRSPLNLFTFMPVVGFVLICCDLIGLFTEKDYFTRNPPGLLAVPICFLLLPLLYLYSTKKQFGNIFPHSQTDLPLTIDIDDERIITETPGLCEGRILWNAIVDFVQNDKITLFYLAKSRFFFVPTKVFSEEQRVKLNDLVARHVAKKKV